jgi:hypothetical protein
MVTVAPGNLRSTVNGSTVQLDWDRVLETVVSHRIEAGSAPGLANLAVLNTGSAANTLVVNGVPAGVYYVRVRAVGPDNVPGPASNEIEVRVGACTGPPGAPSNFAAQVNGNNVTLTWAASSGGNQASSYIVEAGSAPGLANLVVFDTGSPSTTLNATAPNGVYYARIRGRNACGAGAASNETVVTVPSTGGGQPPVGETPWVPPPGPEPPGPPPPVTTLVPELQVSVPVAEPPAVIPGPPPRPDAAAGPAVEVSVVSSPTPTTRRVRVAASRPVDTLILAADTRVSTASDRYVTTSAASSYYLIRLSSAQTIIELTLTIAQSFTGQIAASFGGGPVGLYRGVPLTSTLGGGAMRATLTWNTTADIDLHVIEPDGTHVYYANRNGRTASLDVDDVNGFGPENIFVPSGGALSGVYQVYLVHFGGASPTTSTVTITVGGGARSATFTRTTTSSGATRTVNVANVNVVNGEIVEVSGARANLTADEVQGPKRQ